MICCLGQLLLADCAGVTIPDSPRVQACIDDSTHIARLVVPLIVDVKNKTAILDLITVLPDVLSHLYSVCINPSSMDQEFFTIEEAAELEVLEYLRQKKRSWDVVVSSISDCFSNATMLFPALKKLVDDSRTHASFDVINADLVAIFAQTNTICTACGIPQPKTPIGPVDIQQCLLAADDLAIIANGIVTSQGDISKIIGGVRAFVSAMPHALYVCGLSL